MLESPLALVLGAGSSRDFGPSESSPFPLGDELRLKIADCLNIHVDDFGGQIKRGSRSIFEAFRMVSKAANDDVRVGNLIGAARNMAQALPGCESIDDLLERHSASRLYSTAGKLAIAECIAAAERGSPLRQNPTNIRIPEINKYSHHWLARFLQNITKGCETTDQLRDVFNRLKVVNFNYDRCFEWFSFLWLRHVYALEERQAWEVLGSLEIVHPYGSLGPLPNGSNSAVPFGADIDSHELFAMYSNILTYSESVEEDRRAEKITALTTHCTKVVFLGFAFHAQNMKLLDFAKGVHREVYATTVNLPEPRWETAQSRIRNSLKQSHGTTVIARSSNSCCELVMDYADRWVA
jgi:hypothetical protein